MANGGDVVRLARAQIGKPYVWAAAGPNSFDCSGLVVYCFKHAAGMTLPHFTGALIAFGKEVKKSELQPGDLVFPDSGHVGIYSGNGKWIEAPHAGANVREVNMWGFWRARRVIAPGTATPAPDTGMTVQPVGLTSSLQAFANLVPALSKIVDKTTDPHTWRDLGFLMIGIACIILGILLLVVGSAGQVTKTVAKSAAKGLVSK